MDYLILGNTSQPVDPAWIYKSLWNCKSEHEEKQKMSTGPFVYTRIYCVLTKTVYPTSSHVKLSFLRIKPCCGPHIPYTPKQWLSLWSARVKPLIFIASFILRTFGKKYGGVFLWGLNNIGHKNKCLGLLLTVC